jgi:hypothetical protein
MKVYVFISIIASTIAIVSIFIFGAGQFAHDHGELFSWIAIASGLVGLGFSIVAWRLYVSRDEGRRRTTQDFLRHHDS